MPRILTVVAVAAFLLAACGEDAKLADPPNDGTVATLPTTTRVPPEPTTTTRPAPTSTTRVPADRPRPVTSKCEPAVDGYALIELEPERPSPRCTIVTAGDRLRIRNATTADQNVDTGFARVTLEPDELLTLDEQLGDVWEPGVHRLKTSLYGVNGPEVWLKS